jgi:hypothetical protein
MTTAAAKLPVLLNSLNGRAGGGVDRRQIRIDDAWLWMRRSAQSPAKVAIWQHAHRGTPTSGSRLWHPPNRLLDTGSTKRLSPSRTFRPHARTYWSACDVVASAALVPDHNVALNATPLCDRLTNNAPRATLRHRATRVSTNRYQRTAQRIS